MDSVSPLDLGYSSSSLVEDQIPAQVRSTAGLRRSCETCRYSKSRCCPSTVDSRRCQRCLKDGKECIFLEAKPRPKRVKTSKTRVAEMEEKLNGIFAILSAKNLDKHGIDADQLDAPSLSTSAVNIQMDSVMIPQQQFDISSVFQPLVMNPLPWPKSQEIPDVIGKGIVSVDKAEVLLHSYGTHAPNFPFIVIQSHYTLEYLRSERPFLLVCILSVCARTDMPLQQRLERELRETLARKVIVNGEKSLDLLQGLLVYLCWYHHFFNPETQQIYQLSQMVISMAVELGITRPERKVKTSISPCKDYHHFGETRARKFCSDLEAVRTFLACYYLSSSLANAFKKPSNLKYSDYVEQCVQTLVDANETQTDHLLPYFIRVQRLCEEINLTFDYDGHQQLPPLDAVRIEMLIKSFSRQLKQFEETFPAEIWKVVAIRMAYQNMQISIHEISLHTCQPQIVGVAPGFGGPSTTDWFSSVARTDSLITCVESAKKYLDVFLALSSEEIHQSTITEEMRLLYAIIVLVRFATGVRSPYLDATHLRKTADIERYMSAIINRISPLITILDNGQEQIDFFWHFKRLFQVTRVWFVEQARLGSFTTLEKSGLHDCEDLAFVEILHTVPEKSNRNDSCAEMDPDLWFPQQDNQMWNAALLEGYPTPTIDPQTINLNGVLQ